MSPEIMRVKVKCCTLMIGKFGEQSVGKLKTTNPNVLSRQSPNEYMLNMQ